MKSLANFIVQNPVNAALVAAFASASVFFAWLGAAAVALYLLRFGLSSARTVVLAALVPSTFWAHQGDVSPLVTLIGAVLLALLLRYRARWSEVVTLLPFVFMALCASILLLAPEYVEQLRSMMAGVIEQFKAQALSNPQLDEQTAELINAIPTPNAQYLMGVMVGLQSATGLVSLLLARWWQSALYNPGGFGSEFQTLRLSRLQIIVLVGAFVVLAQFGHPVWGWACLLPVVVSGIAMVHGLVAIANMPSRWLVGFYVVLLLFRPAAMLLIVLAVIDSAIDFRGRMRQRTQ